MLEVPLRPGLPGGAWARLGPLTGAIEERLDATDPAAIGSLVDQLLEPAEGTTVGPGSAFDLALSDLDRIAAQLYRAAFGDRIESVQRCHRCGQSFEAILDLAQLLPPLPEEPAAEVAIPDAQGRFRIGSAGTFRLPTLRDQLALGRRALAPAEAAAALLQRCVEPVELAEAEAEALEAAMEAAGPLASGTVRTPCPHCRADDGSLTFDLPTLLLDALASERSFLYQEIHYLARAYGWSRAEILALPREDRRHHVRLVLAERAS